MSFRALGAILAFAACQPVGPSRVAAPADSAAGEVAFRLAGPNEAAILVPVRVNGRGPFEFVLDTGATLTCVDEGLADSLDLSERRGLLGFGAGVGGSIGLEAQGLLGLDFLKPFRVVLDFEREVLRLEDPALADGTAPPGR